MAKKRKDRTRSASAPLRPKREIVVGDVFLDDLLFWIGSEPRIAVWIGELMQEVMRDPFSGRGKPEPLKYVLGGTWSRRLTGEHRMTYLVEERRITFLAARFHYRA